jgi:hypothetical protein
MIAKRSLRDDWEKERDTVLKNAREELLGATVKFVVDYDAIWKTIVAGKKVLVLSLVCVLFPPDCLYSQVNKDVDPQDKARSFGRATLGYFEGFVYSIKTKLVRRLLLLFWLETNPFS